MQNIEFGSISSDDTPIQQKMSVSEHRIGAPPNRKAAAKRGNTSNMFTYISEHHLSVQIQLVPFIT